MKGKNLQLKTAFRAVMLILMLGSVGIMKGYAAYDFSAVCSTGQTLYYKITDANNHYVKLVYPGSSSSSAWSNYTKPTGNMVLPSSVYYQGSYYTVKIIGDETFFDCIGLTSITIPQSVSSIESYAFDRCTGLTSITIPQSVTSMGENPFLRCSNLAHISVESGNTVYDSRNNCNAIIRTNTNQLVVGCISSTIPNSVTSIGRRAFQGSGITSIDIPNSVTLIGDVAFCWCGSLTNVNTGDGVTYIASRAFLGCEELLELTIGESVTEISSEAFWDCPSLTTVHFNAINCSIMGYCDEEDDLEDAIPVFSSAYNWSTPNITTVTIGDNVTKIPDFAFKDCSNITGEILIPNSVTTIGGCAFYNCAGLTSFTLGTSLNTIYSWAFRNCSNVSSISIFDTTPAGVYSDAFSGIGTGIPVYVPCGTTQIYSNGSSLQWYWRRFTNYQEQNWNNLVVSSNDNYKGTAEITQAATCSDNAIVTAIPNAGAFLNWTEGGDVVSTDNPYSFELTSDRNLVANFVPVEIIEGDYKYTVDLVTGEASVKANNTSVTTSSFATSITYQSIDYPVTSIAKDGFKDCISITEMIIPNSIITIESGAFSRCRFTKVVIPSSVTLIGQQAFFNCISLNEVIFEDGLALITLYNNKYSDGIGGGLFENCPVEKAYIGRNIVVSNYYDSYNRPWTNAPFSRWTSGVYAPLSEVTLGNNVTKLCDYFFERCNAITSIVSCIDHPASMTMGSGVFRQVPTSTCVLYVPAGSLEEYQSTAQWSDFSNIQTMAYVTISGYGSSTESDKWAFIASPLADDMDPEDIDGLIATTPSDFDLYQLNPAATNEWENWKQTGDHYHFNLVNGRGYLYANRNDVNIILQGDMFTGDYKDVTLQTGWNLVGNPYAQLAYINRSYYKMNAAGDDIEAVSAYTTTAIPVCTGVVVQSASNSDVVRFTKTAPSKSTGNDGLQMTLAKAGTRGSEIQDKAIVSFDENTQLGKYIFNENHAKLYIPQDGNDYAIAYSDGQHTIPLYFRTKEIGTYTINFNNDAELENVYLVDKFEGAVIDLSVCSSYTFIGSSSDRPDRFELVFGYPTGSETDSFVYQSGNEIIVSGEGELQVFDVMGRMVAKQYVNGVEMIAKPSVTGVYIFRLNEKTQKIVVK